MIGPPMPKSLGQIHTTKYNYEGSVADITDNRAFLCDNSAKLSNQFNRNVRMMNSYKWVGADLVLQLPETINPLGSESTEVSVKGRMRFFQPTRGRCSALRDAYKQFREMCKSQGIDPTENKLFDFRVLPRSMSNYPLNPTWDPIYNVTTLNGTDELVMTDGPAGTTVFDTHNANVRPRASSVVAGTFSSGLETWQLGTQTDFVLEEGLIQSGNTDEADVQMEEIPFALTFDGVDKRTYSLQWRPDPALYVSVLGGFVEIVLDEIKADGATGGILLDGFEMDISMHWAGWKSIVRAPRSRRNRFPNRQQKKIAKQVGGVLTSKEAKALARLIKKMM